MTHNTPNGTDERRRWCANCEVSVAPSSGEDGPICPACGDDLNPSSP